MDRREERREKSDEEAKPVQHMAAPEVEERQPHAYEGEGLGRRESLRGEELPKDKPRHEADK